MLYNLKTWQRHLNKKIPLNTNILYQIRRIKPHWIPSKIYKSSVWTVQLIPAPPMYTGHVTDIPLSFNLTKQMTRQWTRPSTDIATMKYTLSGNWTVWKDTKRKCTWCKDRRYRLMAKICMHYTLIVSLWPSLHLQLRTTEAQPEIIAANAGRHMCTTRAVTEQKHGIHLALVLRVCFMPFCFNALCQFIPLLHLHFLISCLTLVGWLRSITLTPYFWREYHFLFTYNFSGTKLGRKTRAGCTDGRQPSNSSNRWTRIKY
jgi:hypothetical protein